MQQYCCGQLPCKDSAVNTKYFNKHFSYLGDKNLAIATKDSGLLVTYYPYDTLVLGAYAVNGILLIKFSANNTIVWSKKLGSLKNYSLQSNGIAELKNGDILITGAATNNGNIYNSFLARLDKNANLLWLKFYNDFFFDLKNLAEETNGNIIVGCLDRPNGNSINRLDARGNIIWSKFFNYSIALDEQHCRISNLFVMNGKIFVTGFSDCSLWNCIYTKPFTLWAMQLDINTASILRINSYSLGWGSSVQEVRSGYFDDRFIISGFAESQNGPYLKLFSVSIDTGLSLLQSYEYNSLMKYTHADVTDIQISPKTGNTTFSISTGQSNTFYYSMINPDFKIRYERKLVSDNAVSNPKPVEKNNERFSYLLSNNDGDYSSFNNIDFSVDYLNKNGCTGEDTTIFIQLPAQVDPGDFFWKKITDNIVSSISGVAQVTDYEIESEVVCKQVSICDSIKIIGNDIVCDISKPQIFKIRKRNDCYKRIDWQIDTSVIQSLTILNDTSIEMKFKKYGQISLAAAIKTCGIKDSLKINIIEPMVPVNLGKDTSLCNSKPIKLSAEKGYINYLWQDGSTNDFFIVDKPGIYSVSTTDYCNNISSDTVTVSNVNSRLIDSKNLSICLGDTVLLSASPGFYNYTWNPTSFLTNLISRETFAFPKSTTDFHLSAEKFPGCIMKDSITVEVKKCPEDIFFSNAFTPNNDGLNDVFKPNTDSRVIEYNLKIYNRWGQIIFESNQINNGWNGKKGNELQPAGIYIWVCNYKIKNQHLKSLKGKVVLLR